MYPFSELRKKETQLLELQSRIEHPVSEEGRELLGDELEEGSGEESEGEGLMDTSFSSLDYVEPESDSEYFPTPSKRREGASETETETETEEVDNEEEKSKSRLESL